MIYLARKLAAEGFIVTIVNIDSIHAIVQKSWKNLPKQDIRLQSISMEIKIPEGFSSENMNAIAAFMDAVMNLEEPLAALFSQLATESGSAVRCVISDYYHTAAPYAASKAGIPSVCFWSGAASWASIEFNIPSLRSRGHIPVGEENAEEVVDYLPGLEPLKAADLPLYLHKDTYYSIGDEKSIFRCKRAEMEPWLLANSVCELEPRVFDAMTKGFSWKFVAVGPLFPHSNFDDSTNGVEVTLRPEDKSALQWLDKQPPQSVLYIAFGSVSVITFDEFEELAAGLEASQARFLWVVPSDLVLRIPDGVLDSFVERCCDRGMVVKWSPQLEVLQHESVGGFLTHCGWNSVFESLCGGVPMLGWPCNSEQNTNCKLMLQDRGIGLPMLDKTRQGIEAAIRSLMEGAEGRKLRNKACDLQELARAAARPGGSSCKNLNDFFKWINP